MQFSWQIRVKIKQKSSRNPTLHDSVECYLKFNPMLFVSILVPAFNEQGNILPTAERIASTLAAQNIPGEILFIDDGSRDETFAEMQVPRSGTRRCACGVTRAIRA